MSDTVKLIVEIPKDIYDGLMNNRGVVIPSYWHEYVADLCKNGTPLDDVKEEIEQDMSFDMFDDYGNKTRIHKELWEIFDNIGKESEEV